LDGAPAPNLISAKNFVRHLGPPSRIRHFEFCKFIKSFIKRICTDKSRSTFRKNLKIFWWQKESRGSSVLNIPQQNGIAERANCTFVEMACC